MSKKKRLSLFLLGLFYMVAGIMHFVKPEIYLKIMPPYLPAPLALVLLSGLAEFAGGLGLFFRKTRIPAAWGIIALLVAVFPANLYMYQHAVETAGAAYPGIAISTLYWRLWGQLPLILWAFWHTRREIAHPYPV
jgi:uncharacterized membrane protein